MNVLLHLNLVRTSHLQDRFIFKPMFQILLLIFFQQSECYTPKLYFMCKIIFLFSSGRVQEYLQVQLGLRILDYKVTWKQLLSLPLKDTNLIQKGWIKRTLKLVDRLQYMVLVLQKENIVLRRNHWWKQRLQIC